jgi:hypothetical protein
MSTFELKLEGRDLDPTRLSIHELTDLLLAVERAVVKTARQVEPGLDEDETVVSLVDIGEGSTRLRFATSVDAVTTAFGLLTQAIAERSFSEIPAPAIDALQEIHKYAQDSEAVVAFYTGEPGHFVRVAEIRPDLDLNFPLIDVVRGTTVIYGKLTRVGGNPPKARLKLLNNEAISCFVSEKLAKRIGNRLYEVIGLTGEARWDADDYSLLSFRAADIAAYEEAPLTQAIRELRDASPTAWQHVENPDAFIEELRGS